jgi:phosphogluconate dehydratase
MSELSDFIPLITRMYPNGAADVNHFHAAGGMCYVIKTLLDKGLLHEDVVTILGTGLRKFTEESKIRDGKIHFENGTDTSLNLNVIRSAEDPFSKDGGIKILKGNIGRSVVKTAAIATENRIVEAPAIVFHEQYDLINAFNNGELNKDFIAVVPFQGPKQNGMPELHNLTPSLTILQKRGYKVGLVTDGRMSGASGKIPAAIHLTPEANEAGPIAQIRNGDIIRINCDKGILELINFDEVSKRNPSTIERKNTSSLGRGLFTMARKVVTSSEQGASFILSD